MASMTAPESMIAPSTIASGGRVSMPDVDELVLAPPLPPDFSSTALTAEEPMSSPTSPFFLPNRATSASLTKASFDRLVRRNGTETRYDFTTIVKVLGEANKGSTCQGKNEVVQ